MQLRHIEEYQELVFSWLGMFLFRMRSFCFSSHQQAFLESAVTATFSSTLRRNFHNARSFVMEANSALRDPVSPSLAPQAPRGRRLSVARKLFHDSPDRPAACSVTTDTVSNIQMRSTIIAGSAPGDVRSLEPALNSNDLLLGADPMGDVPNNPRLDLGNEEDCRSSTGMRSCEETSVISSAANRQLVA